MGPLDAGGRCAHLKAQLGRMSRATRLQGWPWVLAVERGIAGTSNERHYSQALPCGLGRAPKPAVKWGPLYSQIAWLSASHQHPPQYTHPLLCKLLLSLSRAQGEHEFPLYPPCPDADTLIPGVRFEHGAQVPPSTHPLILCPLRLEHGHVFRSPHSIHLLSLQGVYFPPLLTKRLCNALGW